MNRILILNIFQRPLKWLTNNSHCNAFAHTNAFTNNIHNKQLERIRDIPIKVYESKFRASYSQHYWKCKDYVYDRVFSICDPKQLESAKNAVYGCTADMLTCFFFPFTINEKRMLPLIEMEAFLFLTDDMIGVQESQSGCDNMFDVITGKRCAVEPNERIIDGVLRNIRVDMTEPEYERYVQSMCDFIIEWRKEMEISKKFRNMNDIIDSREYSACAYPYIYLIPYSLGIDITKYTENPILKQMDSLIVKHVFLVNDIFSIKKEVDRREVQTPFNCLLFLYNEINDLDKAVNKIFGLLDDIESEFFRCKHNLRAQYPNCIEINLYTDALEYFGGGNMVWSQFAPRYNKFNRYSIRTVLNQYNFPELIPEVEKLHSRYNENY